VSHPHYRTFFASAAYTRGTLVCN